MSENKKYREIIAECARTREYPPDHREDGSKMSLAERAALAPTMPLRNVVKGGRDHYMDQRVADHDRARDEIYDLYY